MGSLASRLLRALFNTTLHLNHVLVKALQGDALLSLDCRSLKAFTPSSNWRKELRVSAGLCTGLSSKACPPVVPQCAPWALQHLDGKGILWQHRAKACSVQLAAWPQLKPPTLQGSGLAKDICTCACLLCDPT